MNRPGCPVAATVHDCLARRELYLDIARRHGSPLYIFEERIMAEKAREFTEAFRSHLPDVRVFYPVKANSHPWVLETAVRNGLGLEVSGAPELQSALAAGDEPILFNGPAKTDEELRSAVRHRDRVTVILDSARELERLERIAAAASVTVTAGVRLAIDPTGLWRKFGVPIAELPALLAAARGCPHVAVRGLHFHTSWNLTPDAHVACIARVGQALRELSPAERDGIEFLDIGGGFWPAQGDWQPVAPPNPGGLVAAPAPTTPPVSGPFFTIQPGTPIIEFARQIAAALDAHVFPLKRCRILAEPGRWICHDALHLLLTVIDRKGADIFVTDGGTNLVGWERFEHEYFPVINLTRPEPVERAGLVLGSLCTPRDVWGYSYFGAEIQPGNVLLLPQQGAYTVSLSQKFIKPGPRLVRLRGEKTESDHERD